jgi:hypothetical protein
LLVLVAACSGGDDKGDDASKKTTTTPPLHAEQDLADGTHFGFVTALDPSQNRMVFDKAELLTGDEAKAAADDAGDVVTEGGSYVLNPDDRMNRITIDDGITIRILVPCCDLHEVSFEKWLSSFDPSDDRTFYGTTKSHYEITVKDGKVTAVDEIRVP